MKSTTLRRTIRVAATICLLLTGAIAGLSFKAKNLANEFWKQLGMTEQQAKEDINHSFLTGYLSYYGAKDIKNIVTGDRAAIAGNILAYTKEYVGSPVFQKEYSTYRNREKAKIYPVAPAITKEELTRKKTDDAQKNIKTYEDLLKTAADASVIKSYKEQLDFWKNALEDYKSPNSTQVTYELQMDANRYKTEKDTYDQLMKKWETNCPESAVQFIKKRLNEFLTATRDIDFKAALADKNNKKVFVNPAYEKKNPKWKMGFRAGKEATETARAFAENWIKEL